MPTFNLKESQWKLLFNIALCNQISWVFLLFLFCSASVTSNIQDQEYFQCIWLGGCQLILALVLIGVGKNHFLTFKDFCKVKCSRNHEMSNHVHISSNLFTGLITFSHEIHTLLSSWPLPLPYMLVQQLLQQNNKMNIITKTNERL